MLKMKSQSSLGSIAWLLIEALPVALPVAMAAFGAVALIFLLADNFSTFWVLLCGGLAAVVAGGGVMWAHRRLERPGTMTEKLLADAAMVILAVLWIGFNINYTSQHVFTDRDPATYAVAGAWLMDHDTLRLQTPEAFQGVDNTTQHSAGFAAFDKKSDEVYAQGQHLLPVFAGLGGRLFGETALFAVNVIIGGVALLAMYGFARLFIRPRWALLAPVIMGASLPMLYLSRDTYSEPLMMACAFGGLAVLMMAMKQRHIWLWAIAGMTFGVMTLARIDAYLVLAALIFAVALWLVFLKRPERRSGLLSAGVFIISAVAVSYIGIMDLQILSPSYFKSIEEPFTKQILLLAASAIVSSCVVVVTFLFSKLLPWLHKATKAWRVPLVVMVVLAVTLFMVTRPFWMESPSSGLNEIVTAIQERAGDPPEARSYAEQTTRWFEWYIGSVTAALGVVGFAIASGLMLRKKQYIPLAAFVLTVAGTALVYMVMPNVTPDQPWAARRFLPVVLPGLTILAVFAIDKACERYLDKERIMWRPAIGAIAGVLLMVAPLAVSWPFLMVRDTARYGQMKQICHNLPDNAAVIWAADARHELVVSTQAFCNKPAVALSTRVEPVAERYIVAPIAQELRARGYVPIIGTNLKDIHFFPTRTDDDFGQLKHTYHEYERTLVRPPQRVTQHENVIVFGEVMPDGTVVPIRDIR